MKFKLDENIPLRLKKIIKEAGHSACDVYEQNLVGKADPVVLKRCREENYVLITNDTDFENIQAYPPGTHAGVILFKLKSQGIPSVTRAITQLLAKVDLERTRGALTIVGPDLIKIRKEP